MGVIDQLRSEIRVRHRYADGRAYRRPWSSAHRAERPFGVAFRSPGLLLTPCPAGGPGMGAARPTGPVDWPEFWRQVQAELRAARFCPGSLRVYRQVLRAFRAFAASHQAEFTAETQWVPRSKAVTAEMRGPKRARRLPETLKPAEVPRLVEAGASLRDRLLLGLLAHAGLKVGEACAVRWGDVNLAAGTLAVRYACGTRTRMIEIPPSVRPLLDAGAPGRKPDDRLFAGRRAGRPLTARMAERIVKQAAVAAGLPEEVSGMRLRHSYAVARLREGMSIRELQARLGHGSLETTMEYQRLLAADGVVSPADRLGLGQAPIDAPATPGCAPPVESAAPPTDPPKRIWRRLVDSLAARLPVPDVRFERWGRRISSA